MKNEKYRIFLSDNFHFLVVKFSVYLNRHVKILPSMLGTCTDIKMFYNIGMCWLTGVVIFTHHAMMQ